MGLIVYIVHRGIHPSSINTDSSNGKYMEEETGNIRAFKKDLDRIKKFGCMGNTMAQALSKALDVAERNSKD